MRRHAALAPAYFCKNIRLRPPPVPAAPPRRYKDAEKKLTRMEALTDEEQDVYDSIDLDVMEVKTTWLTALVSERRRQPDRLWLQTVRKQFAFVCGGAAGTVQECHATVEMSA